MVQTLDPTQYEAYAFVRDWAVARLHWRQAVGRQSLTAAPPPLRFLLLGTAGTGKTYTAKTFIAEARRTLGSFEAVLTLAFSGVAAANLGDGASTIDSVFHTNKGDAHADLEGDGLDRLVEKLRRVELLVIDEISTVGAASFEIINRRLQQVRMALWRLRFDSAPPHDMSHFGGIGVVCMGDFAQLPPVLSTSLLPGSSVQEGKKDGMRTLALTGIQTFQTFQDVVRLRRIHRVQGADPFKDCVRLHVV